VLFSIPPLGLGSGVLSACFERTVEQTPTTVKSKFSV
jgi:hypothetical protein